MGRIIEIEELGFPKSIIVREGNDASELIYGCMLADELNIQLRNDKLNLLSLQSVIKDLEVEIETLKSGTENWIE